MIKIAPTMFKILYFVKFLIGFFGVAFTFVYLLRGLVSGDMKKYKTAVLIFLATAGGIFLITILESLVE